MEAKIIKQTKNVLLKRTDYVLEIKSNANPGEEAIKDFLGKDKDLTIVQKITSNFGKNTFMAEAVVYDSKESKTQVVTIPKKVRKEMEEVKKKAEADAKKKADAEAAAKAAEAAKAGAN
jgi:ribosomal protein S24E